MPGRPPVNEMTTAMQNAAYRPTFGSTPAMIEKAMASGISASATTRPASTSPRMLPNHCWRSVDAMFKTEFPAAGQVLPGCCEKTIVETTRPVPASSGRAERQTLGWGGHDGNRSEGHTSELQYLM